MKNVNALKTALFIPANRNDFIAKAHTRGADAIILDLEDSVVVSAKKEARDNVASAAAVITGHGMATLVRINPPWRLAVRDLEASIGENVHCIVVPKASSAAHIEAIAETITDIETEKGLAVGHTKLLAFIEDPAALAKAAEIASASSRVLALSLGTEDFSASIGSVANSEMLFNACQQIVFAARAAGVQPLGFIGSIADFNDMDAFRETIKRSRDMGFRGACCIHPKQVAVVNEEFTASAEEVEHAKGVIATFEEAQAKGLGAVAYKGEMIDRPVYNRALAIIS